jgi:hypothetical protein
MMKTKFQLSLVLFVSIFLILSCKKFVQVPAPETQAELSKIFADDKTAESAATGLYFRMVASGGAFANAGLSVNAALSADEITNVSTNSTYDVFKNNDLLSTNTTISNTFWTEPYRLIYHTNAVLEGLRASTTLSDQVRNQLRGEMLYSRSLLYFWLSNIFGAIPLQTATDYQINAVMPRTDTAGIHTQIIADLKEARSLLINAASNLRPGREAATALLARVYLYRKDWANAAAMATEVVSSNKYILEALTNVFVATSKESIFQLYKQNTNTGDGATFVPTSTTVRPTFTVTNNLLNSFEAADLRKSNWLKSNMVSGVAYFYPYKYKVRAITPVTEYTIVQRLAELYLIRAEARANLNDLSGAIDDVDMVRKRAGLGAIKVANPTISKADLIEAIYKERQLELFTELGHRWFDLKRTGRANDVLATLKGSNWQSTDQLFPIPFTQIELNPFLTQNDGYSN